MNYTINKNETYNSYEVTFEKKPSAEVRTGLKDLRMRWNPKKQVWYGFATYEEIKGAIETPKTEKKTKTKVEKSVENMYGVKVGDIFKYSYGYDATYYDFYQVKKIVGKKAILVQKVEPARKNYEATDPCSWKWTLENDGTDIKSDAPLEKKITSLGYNNKVRIRAEYDWSAYLMTKGTHTISEDNYH